MAWTPEARAKAKENYKEKVRLGIASTARMQKRLDKIRNPPILRHPSIESMFESKGDKPIDTRRTAMKYVRLLADGHPKLSALAEAWDKLPEVKRERTPLDKLCEKVEL